MTKPALSQWIEDQRKLRGWKAEDVARRLREMGYDAEDSTYRTWEASRRPKPETIHGMEKLFGSPAPREPEGTADMAALVVALGDQTAAINALVGLSAQAQRELVADVVSATLAPLWEEIRALRAQVASLQPRD
ncbi:MAG: hypothetical protein KF809_17285 [Chloroflexi bacterium]|nr:hypothetical protein [Chloroflexota bacterium]